jgi:hypothetical protein
VVLVQRLELVLVLGLELELELELELGLGLGLRLGLGLGLGLEQRGLVMESGPYLLLLLLSTQMVSVGDGASLFVP